MQQARSECCCDASVFMSTSMPSHETLKPFNSFMHRTCCDRACCIALAKKLIPELPSVMFIELNVLKLIKVRGLCVLFLRAKFLLRSFLANDHQEGWRNELFKQSKHCILNQNTMPSFRPLLRVVPRAAQRARSNCYAQATEQCGRHTAALLNINLASCKYVL